MSQVNYNKTYTFKNAFIIISVGFGYFNTTLWNDSLVLTEQTWPEHNPAYLAGVHEVVVGNNVHRAGELSGGSLLRHFLDTEGLMVLVHGQSVLRLQQVPFLILGTEQSLLHDIATFNIHVAKII